MTYRCRYCRKRIDAKTAGEALRAGKEPGFCSPEHRASWHTRRHKLMERGLAGEALDRKLAELAKGWKPRARKDAAPALEVVPSPRVLRRIRNAQGEIIGVERLQSSSARKALLDDLDALIGGNE